MITRSCVFKKIIYGQRWKVT